MHLLSSPPVHIAKTLCCEVLPPELIILQTSPTLFNKTKRFFYLPSELTMIMITACLQLTMGLLLLGGQRQVSSVHATSFRGAVYPVDERREVAPVQHKLPLTSILASLSDSSPVAAQERLAVKGSVSPNKKKKQFRRNLKKTCQPTPAPWTCPSTCTCQHDASICTTHSDCDTAGTCKNSEGPCSSDCDCNGGGDKCQGESAGTCLEATPPVSLSCYFFVVIPASFCGDRSRCISFQPTLSLAHFLFYL